MANLQLQKQNTEQDLKLPRKRSATFTEASLQSALGNASLVEVNLEQNKSISKNISIADQVYNKFVSVLEGPIKVASDQVEEMLKPLSDTMMRYVKTIDLDKLKRDMTPYAKETLQLVIKQANEIGIDLQEFIKEQTTPAQRNTITTLFKEVSNFVIDKCEYCVKPVMKIVDYIGNKTIGQEYYAIVKDTLYNLGLSFYKIVQDVIQNLYQKFQPDVFIKPESKEIGLFSNDSKEGDIRAASSALVCLEDVSSFAKNHFGNKNESFFSHRITDSSEKDKMIENQPDVIRKDLMQDLTRNIFDPFPSYEDRVKDGIEESEKAQYMAKTGSKFVRVGIDNELSASDRLDLLTINGRHSKS